jgi:hypothetical protein
MRNKVKKISPITLSLLVALFLSGCGYARSSKTINLGGDFSSDKSNNSVEKTADEGTENDVAEKIEDNSKGRENIQTEDKTSGISGKDKEERQGNNQDKGGLKIINRLVSWGYEKAKSREIDTIIIHSTYNATGGDEFDFEKIIGIYKSYGVAPHYIISREAKIYQLVSDENIAYHAGESRMPDGRTGVNNFSIGIEIINSKTQGPTDGQYEALKKLIKSLKSKYQIKYLLGHADIASGRKDDPWKFDWGRIK